MIAAKKYKANQQEYDSLAQIIAKHPDRENSQSQNNAIQSEIEGLQKGQCFRANFESGDFFPKYFRESSIYSGLKLLLQLNL